MSLRGWNEYASATWLVIAASWYQVETLAENYPRESRRVRRVESRRLKAERSWTPCMSPRSFVCRLNLSRRRWRGKFISSFFQRSLIFLVHESIEYSIIIQLVKRDSLLSVSRKSRLINEILTSKNAARTLRKINDFLIKYF